MNEVKGNLLEKALLGEFNVIIHGCNCFNTMGAGIAAQIKEVFGMNYYIDQQTQKGDVEKLGTIDYVHYEGSFVGDNKLDLFVVNAYTQYKCWGEGRKVDYDAVRMCFRAVAEEFSGGARVHGDIKIGYPMIGAGLAGGDWDVIKQIIDEELDGFDHTVVIFEPMTPAEQGREAKIRG